MQRKKKEEGSVPVQLRVARLINGGGGRRENRQNVFGGGRVSLSSFLLSASPIRRDWYVCLSASPPKDIAKHPSHHSPCSLSILPPPSPPPSPPPPPPLLSCVFVHECLFGSIHRNKEHSTRMVRKSKIKVIYVRTIYIKLKIGFVLLSCSRWRFSHNCLHPLLLLHLFSTQIHFLSTFSPPPPPSRPTENFSAKGHSLLILREGAGGKKKRVSPPFSDKIIASHHRRLWRRGGGGRRERRKIQEGSSSLSLLSLSFSPQTWREGERQRRRPRGRREREEALKEERSRKILCGFEGLRGQGRSQGLQRVVVDCCF